MKTVEVLFSEFGNMYGEVYNPMFLEKSCSKIKLIYTKLNEEPYFMKHKVDMVYIGNMRDLKMYDILDKLKQYKKKIKEMIEDNVVFLLTGNALEMFGSYILENGKETEALDANLDIGADDYDVNEPVIETSEEINKDIV